MLYKKLYDTYGKGLLVPVEPEGNETYSYDSSDLLLLTSNGAINAESYNDDGGGFTKEEIESGLNFVFGYGAPVLFSTPGLIPAYLKYFLRVFHDISVYDIMDRIIKEGIILWHLTEL